MLKQIYYFLFFIFIFSSAIADNEIVSYTSTQEYISNSQAKMTPDGRYIVYVSTSYDIAYIVTKIFLYDRKNNSTELISETPVNTGRLSFPSISNDGRYIVYQSTELNQTNDVLPASLMLKYSSPETYYYHIYIHDRLLGKTTLVSANQDNPDSQHGNIFPKISGDGKTLIYVQ